MNSQIDRCFAESWGPLCSPLVVALVVSFDILEITLQLPSNLDNNDYHSFKW